MIVTVKADVDPRANINGMSIGNTLLEKYSKDDINLQKVFTFSPALTNYGVDGNQIDIPKPLEFSFKVLWQLDESEIPECQNDPKNINCPMIDPRSGKEQDLDFYVELKAGCQNNDACKCNLEISNKNPNEDHEIVIGEINQIIKLSFVIQNTGTEPGYGARLQLYTPQVNLSVPLESGKEICEREMVQSLLN